MRNAHHQTKDRYNALRRALHACFAFSLAYYLIPDPVPVIGLAKPLAALAGVGVVAALEAWRIRQGWTTALFREYERRSVAGYFWLGAGCVLALVAFPKPLAAAAIAGTALVDPLIGELRWRAPREVVSVVGWSAWVLVAAAAGTAVGALAPGLLLGAGALAAVLAEGRRVPRVDDDFLMTLAPLLVMAALAAALRL